MIGSVVRVVLVVAFALGLGLAVKMTQPVPKKAPHQTAFCEIDGGGMFLPCPQPRYAVDL